MKCNFIPYEMENILEISIFEFQFCKENVKKNTKKLIIN